MSLRVWEFETRPAVGGGWYAVLFDEHGEKAYESDVHEYVTDAMSEVREFGKLAMVITRQKTERSQSQLP